MSLLTCASLVTKLPPPPLVGGLRRQPLHAPLQLHRCNCRHCTGVIVAEHERFTVSLPPALIRRARSAVRHTPDLTLVRLTAAALEREIQRLEQERGATFPDHRGPLRTGRPDR